MANTAELAPIARVAISAPLYRLFDYLIPPALSSQLLPGMRLLVPFGRRRLVAVLIETSDHSSFDNDKLKTVISCLDSSPTLPTDMLQLLNWAASYYQHPVGEVMHAALPARMRQGQPATDKAENCWISCAQSLQDVTERLSRAPKQRQLLQTIIEHPGICDSGLNELLRNWRPALKALLEKNLIEKSTAAEAPQHQPVEQAAATAAADIVPNSQQQAVIDSISQQLGTHAVHLLYGVTGSGKTEVYIQLAQACISKGKQVLLLVPEISLTPQLTERFQQRLADNIGILHSAMSDGERQRIWLAASKGELAMLIGTRSAVFTPIPDLGMIIIDEEHDNSYKQQDGFRYHARDVAIVRARNAGIPIILGSGTPSLESLYNASQQRYQLHQITQRAASKTTTRLELIDMRRQPIIEGISEKLLNNIATHIEAGNQAMLFLNRRGFSPVLLCHQCGATMHCKRCDAHMTYHRNKNKLQCHHCDSIAPVPDSCAECGSDELIALGSGTERIDSLLAEHFPDTKVCRIDRDTTRKKGALQDKLDSVKSGEAQILIGTQMLAKGHDFPDVTLVGILDTDQALYSADFRAAEHMAQLIVQVAGRAGRAHKPGEVQIQTHHPDHPLLQTLLHHGYQAFSETALEERQAAGLPPYSHMMILRCEAHQTDIAYQFMYRARDLFQQYASDQVSVFGPVAAPMERRAGRYRSQIILQSPQRKPLHQCSRSVIPQLLELKSARKVRWSIDVDPVDTY